MPFAVNQTTHIFKKTDNTNLVTTIHTWFDAQVSDHGNDAMGM